MTWWQALLLGIVQGLTEFLPVSSSGHLVLAQNLFGVTEEGAVFFFVMLHFATALAVAVGLWRPIAALFRKGNRMNIVWLIVATIPAGLIGLLFNGKVNAMFFFVALVVDFFLVTAALLLVTEIVCKRNAKLLDGNNAVDETDAAPKIKWWQALVMGGAQACALFPGISRSGSTICAGMLAGADKKSVADFSFLMSIPVILASALLEMIGIATGDGIGSVNWFFVAIGMCAAFASGLGAIKLMLALVRRVDYKWFALYLVVLSVVLCVLQFAL